MLIVAFTTGTEFNPHVRSTVCVFRNRSQMKKNKPFYTGLEPLSISARNVASMVQAQGENQVEIDFRGYLPENSRGVVLGPFRRRKISVKYHQG